MYTLIRWKTTNMRLKYALKKCTIWLLALKLYNYYENKNINR